MTAYPITLPASYDLADLHQDILAVLPTHLGITFTGSSVSAQFPGPLVAADQTTLNNTVAAHVPGRWKVKLMRYLPTVLGRDVRTPPLDLDFTVGLSQELNKVVTQIFQGDQNEIIYYATYDSVAQTYSDPVIRRTFSMVYSSPPGPSVITVTETLYWYLENGTQHATTKTLVRYYRGQRRLDWYESKREQIIKWLRYNVMVYMFQTMQGPPWNWTASQIMTEGAAVFKQYVTQISAYTTGHDMTFDTSIAADTRTWLDNVVPGSSPSITIRGVFHQQLAYTV